MAMPRVARFLTQASALSERRSRRLRLSLALTAMLLLVVAAAPPAYAASQPSTVVNLPTQFAFPTALTNTQDGSVWFAESGKIGRVGPPPSRTVTEFPLPAGHSAKSITIGPDGNLWFTEPTAGRIGRITPSSGAVTEFPLAGNSAYGTPVNRPQSITTGPDGKLWFTQTIFSRQSVRTVGSKIASLDTNGTFQASFTLPSGNTKSTTTVADAIVATPGFLWFTDTQQGRIDQITTGGVLTTHQFQYGSPTGLVVGSDGAFWFPASFFGPGGSSLARMSLSGDFSRSAFTIDGQNGASVGAIAAGADGTIWFADYDMTSSAGSIFSRSVKTGAMTRYTFSVYKEIDGLGARPDGTVWFGETDNQSGQSLIGRITP
jgi:virginiamycin B lyase